MAMFDGARIISIKASMDPSAVSAGPILSLFLEGKTR